MRPAWRDNILMAVNPMPAAEADVTADLVTRLLAEQHPDLAGQPVRFLANGWDKPRRPRLTPSSPALPAPPDAGPAAPGAPAPAAPSAPGVLWRGRFAYLGGISWGQPP
jgi:hypothetical protein